MSDPYLGEIRMVGFNFAPYGWALCQGQILPVSQNQALFSLLGTTFGGNGSSNFGLPDLQGRGPIGTGTGTGLSPITWGEVGGQEEVTLTTNQLPTHTHASQSSSSSMTSTGTISIPATTSSTGGTGTPSATTVLGPMSQGGRAGELYSTSAPNVTLAPFGVTVMGDAPRVTIGTTGNSLPTPLRNPYLGLTCIVALQGIFPTRG
ncbi:phage tail protein [Trinickia fusca]|uniref:Phage tail protein n=1 Tax=Trinickia fusca TaxID=2419777 RepID=A0A494XKP5_9BURK|nr:tail fiber protein [Trinickia fusca]RKP48113.1 phage tail protein [Trinickia fusca]